MLLLNPRRTRTNMKLLQLVWIFLLTLCGQSATTTMMVKEDDDVILDCSIGATSTENKKFDWKKNVDQEGTAVFLYADNKPQPGQQFVNRVSHFPDQLKFGNASIKITKVQTKDNGTYTCYYIPEAKIPLPVIQATVSLTVGYILKPRPEIEGAAPKPSVTILDQPQKSALLQCEILGAFPKPEVVWMDSDGTTLDADEPKVTKREGNKFDTVLNVTVTKTDHYTCVATQKEINHQNNRTIFVRLNGAAPRPFITVHKTNNGMLLQCEVLGAFPKPEVQWWDSDGNVLAVGDPQIRDGKVNKYDTVLNVTVIKSGDYRCVSTQDDIHHQIYTKTHVIPGAASKPSAKPIKNTDNGVLLQCEVFGASPELKVFWKDKAGNLVHSEEQKTETGGGYDIILLTTVTKTDYYRCVTTEGKKDDEIYDEIYVQGRGDTSNNSISGVVGIVVGSVIAVGAIVAAVVVVLYFRKCDKQRFRGPTPIPAASSSKQEIL